MSQVQEALESKEAEVIAAERRQPRFDFGRAWGMLVDGRRMTRACWAGCGAWIEIHDPSGAGHYEYVAKHYPPCAPYRNGAQVPWTPDALDLFAKDWEVVRE